MDVIVNGSDVFVGGQMTTCWNDQEQQEQVGVNNIAMFSGGQWQDLGPGGFFGNITAFAFNRGILYTIGKKDGVGYMQSFDGQNWKVVSPPYPFFFLSFKLTNLFKRLQHSKMFLLTTLSSASSPLKMGCMLEAISTPSNQGTTLNSGGIS